MVHFFGNVDFDVKSTCTVSCPHKQIRTDDYGLFPEKGLTAMKLMCKIGCFHHLKLKPQSKANVEKVFGDWFQELNHFLVQNKWILNSSFIAKQCCLAV